MTRATISTNVRIEHRFEVPCPDPWGGDWHDFGVARHWAEKRAQDLGIDTSTDDWSRIVVEDDSVVIVLTETHDLETWSSARRLYNLIAPKALENGSPLHSAIAGILNDIKHGDLKPDVLQCVRRILDEL